MSARTVGTDGPPDIDRNVERQRERRFVRELSADTKRFRFLHAMKELSPTMLARFTQIDYSQEMALVALLDETIEPRQVGVARYCINPGGRSAEFAIVVGDSVRRRGIGTRLMRSLTHVAREQGLEMIEALANAGKHVLLEKPVARTVEEALRVVEICERAGVALGVVFQHRMRDSSKAAARLMASGALGRVGLVEIAVPLWREQSYYDELERGTYARDGGGVLITQAIHTIDLALSLTGPVSRVQAMTATTALHRMEAEDFAVAGLHFASGAVGSLVASTATFPHGRETITVHGEHGSMHLGADAMNISWSDGRRERNESAKNGAGVEGPVVVRHEWHGAVIDDFIDAVQEERPPMVSGRVALASHRLIEAIETSSRSGSAVELVT